ncbi:MAG: RCC1 domain-containing protein, partial [bacterium]|nr:RCC1 domain-containing protein [bacterium]
ATGATFRAVSVGYQHSCGILTDGGIECWGDNYFGEAHPPAGTFLDIARGVDHWCGVRSDKTIVC